MDKGKKPFNRLLVTGGSGFLGQAIVARLLDDGWEVVVIDNLVGGMVLPDQQGLTIFKDDISNPAVFERIPEIDAVIHLASLSSSEISFERPVDELSASLIGATRLVDFCKQKGVNRFIFASSMSVYGNIGKSKEGFRVDENDSVELLSYYAIGKKAVEDLLLFEQSPVFTPVSLRFFNLYGPNQNLLNTKQGMVSIFLAQLFKGSNVVVRGDVGRIRDFVYIDDAVEAVLSALSMDSVSGIFNISTNQGTSVIKLIETMGRVLAIQPRTVVESGTPGDLFAIVGDNAKAKSVLRWTPKYDLLSGLQSTMRNMEKGSEY